ncbi:DUF6716 putative glycosyltransferase [Sinorhizobium fredii]|uniref:DUF6716 putative glycosyltransferase n=1 Tax=Rhizobium fredii TaxID=380 RepID=UPI0029586CFE|nr:DUF6716 putative glycosyltransferase [Sinorhizobium fredii]WOS65243.1 DUF6716 putative glycosyltransferase [Sinorhizobium fredii GR64]
MYSADSYVGYCNILYEHLVTTACEVEVVEVTSEERKPGLSEAQRKKWGASFPKDGVHRTTERKLIDRIVSNNPDFLFLGIPGRKVFRICNNLERRQELNPSMTIATGFPGLQYYMKFTGLFWRAFVDRLLFTDPHLYQLGSKLLSRTPLRTTNCVLFGSPRIRDTPPRDKSIHRRYIAFFEQNEVPASREQRIELSRQLALLADAHKDKTLLIVARNRPGETSNHQTDDDMRLDRILLQREGRTVEVFNGDWLAIADEIEFALSVSSTALLEASLMQIPSFSLRIARSDETRFDAFRFFQRLGFERAIDELATSRVLEPLQGASEFLIPYDPATLSQVLSPRARPRRPARSHEILLRRGCVAMAMSLDWSFRLLERQRVG